MQAWIPKGAARRRGRRDRDGRCIVAIEGLLDVEITCGNGDGGRGEEEILDWDRRRSLYTSSTVEICPDLIGKSIPYLGHTLMLTPQ
jgi:hypothetical protein